MTETTIAPLAPYAEAESAATASLAAAAAASPGVSSDAGAALTPGAVRPRRRTGRSGPRWRVRPGLLLAGLFLLLVIAWAIIPQVFAPLDPTVGIASDALQGPSAIHWFGTDATGRDVYSRVVHGSVHTLSSALIAVGLGLVIGTFIGLIAGSLGGWIDAGAMRIVDVLLAIPSLLLSLSIVIILGFGTAQIAIAVGVTSIAAFSRLARAEVLRVRSTDYVEAAFASGGTFFSVMFRHVLPNSLTPVVALGALQFGTAILAISALGFLGYGAPPPTPEWGLMIAEGRNYVATAWWLTTIPGLIVVFTVLAANRFSSAIAERSNA
ncbi:ABC transporter permease [Microbacterium allomyrinae]|uniref:ABC transporter permease n=1 Tax=Microbacterium allomyrinae TaxID=2830666 RepID=A0A9X1S323_9MICO|nr:ABC transporter permease [Microbacterium allomyrinae]MCC2031558.1 ABC transporter permease [Microbacterium allomyrinae]